MKSDITIRMATNDDRLAWDRVVQHPIQSWAWGEFRQSMNVDVVRLVVEQSGKIINVAQLTFHAIPHLPYTIGYFPKGEMPNAAMLAKLAELAKEKHAIFIQLEPNVFHPIPYSLYPIPSLRPSHHPLFTKYTFILDLTKMEDELLKAMHPKTRYNIKVAQKHDVLVKEDNSADAFEAYLRLSNETTTRQGFYAHNEVYHRTMWDILSKNNIAHLWTATYQEKILAAWIIFAWKDSIYYPYGTSSRDHKEVMAPHLLLWEIAKWGKKGGYKKFDLWGALGPPPAGGPDEHDPWYGFHRFKEGFSPELIEFIGSFDLIINPMLYKVYTVADKIRWKILKR